MQEQLSVQDTAVASFGTQLRYLRTRAGLGQESLARQAGVGVSTLKALESGKRQKPQVHTLRQLARALELGPAERAELVELAAASLQPSGEPSSASVRAAGPMRLPPTASTLIGREADVAAARTLLEQRAGLTRLVTLVGPGGVGKTRLAIEVASSLVDAYPDGVVFVDLVPLSDARLVSAVIARALELRENGGRSAHDLLPGYLKRRQVLLVLDNFEHLLPAPPLVSELVRRCPGVALLVTSRVALNLQAERRVGVGPLQIPARGSDNTPPALAASPAVKLFVERARAVVGEFALTATNAMAVASICRRLDGLPLAIELAAARVPLLPPAALLRRLEHPLSVLTGGGPDVPRRHKALRAALAWSVDLLEPGQQALFRRLGAFVGGWSVEAAEVDATDAAQFEQDVLDGLQVLVDSSLVHRLDDGSFDSRFGMLETVREYALEQLGQHDEVKNQSWRHAAYFLNLAEKAEPQLRGEE
jgi:predicted ATPase/DNA-binding XRE family transcriptional regulator